MAYPPRELVFHPDAFSLSVGTADPPVADDGLDYASIAASLTPEESDYLGTIDPSVLDDPTHQGNPLFQSIVGKLQAPPVATLPAPAPEPPPDPRIPRGGALDLVKALRLDHPATWTGEPLTAPQGLRPNPAASAMPQPDGSMLWNAVSGVASLPAAAMGAGMGALIDQPGDLGHAARAAWDETVRLGRGMPATTLGAPDAPTGTTMSAEAARRGVAFPPAAAAVGDFLGDPLNFGNPALDAVKVAVAAKGLTAAGLAAAKGGAVLHAAAMFPNFTKAVTEAAEATKTAKAATEALKLPKTARPAFIVAETLKEGGYSVNLATGAKPTEGFMVGAFPNNSGKAVGLPIEKFTPAAVKKFQVANAKELAKADMHMGTWIERDAAGAPKTVWLDVSKQHENPRTATKQGELMKQPGALRDPVTGEWPVAQLAIWDVANKGERPIGNFYEFANSPEMDQRLDTLFVEGAKVMNGKDWWNLYGGPLAEVYGDERVRPLAGFLASTSPASTPDQNLRSASEYIRRLIKNEPIIQPNFRIPEDAFGFKSGSGYNGPGTQMPMEQSRKNNLLKAAVGDLDRLSADKVNDMGHLLVGDDGGVYDRRWAKAFEAPERGIYAETQKDKLLGSMDTGKISNYAIVQNVVRNKAKSLGMTEKLYSAHVWEGIGETIKKTGDLFGTPHPAHAIPDASEGFNNIFPKMLADKAAHLGITVDAMKARLRAGDAELLGVVLATPVGWAAYQLWEQGQAARPPAGAAGPPS